MNRIHLVQDMNQGGTLVAKGSSLHPQNGFSFMKLRFIRTSSTVVALCGGFVVATKLYLFYLKQWH
jgi:hypothetical protein